MPVYAIGGNKMKEAGAKILWDFTSLSSIGLIESLYPAILISWKLRKLEQTLINKKIKTVVLVDNQGVNIQLARLSKKLGLYVIYYFPPHVSIWGKRNAKLLARYCDLVLSPFYKDHLVYKAAGAPSLFTGHPFTQLLHQRNFKEREAVKTVGLFPGSRKQEIKKLLPMMLNLAADLSNKKDLIFYLVVSSEKFKLLIQNELERDSSIKLKLIDQGDYEKYQDCDLAITASGTVTLELALLKVPMMVLYHVHPLTYWIAKRILKIQWVAMPNILLREHIVPEYLQGDLKLEKLKNHILEWIANPDLLTIQLNKLDKVYEVIKGEEAPIDFIADQILNSI